MGDDTYPMFDPQYFRIEDPYPELPLGEIHPISSRAWALFCRSKTKDVVRLHLVRIAGAIDMMRGLDYHNANFCRVIAELALLPFLHPVASERHLFLVHETVAYLNRLGQFYYFASSQPVSNMVPKWRDMIPTIARFKIFRDKHTAHRSLDQPKREDRSSVQEVRAWAFSSLGGQHFHLKPGAKQATSPAEAMSSYKRWIENYLCFQLIGDGGQDTLNLSIEREHPTLMDEAYQLISTLLSEA
jgi:hypothetical protein